MNGYPHKVDGIERSENIPSYDEQMEEMFRTHSHSELFDMVWKRIAKQADELRTI